ncbi:quinone oxidoreductase family protein [Limoniibacter endophyticus]|uniref:Quinone oxidoreductase n=1 Tax=Limoniibacter endophyticus TaxID=1565040 RepID=A0A8J3DHP2_9HYPH|nr:quinone oxidoreductase [Limoniibacter endophyticus]GHC72085.1 quinone oxidoreductase [Limoniibacter endophyticus]
MATTALAYKFDRTGDANVLKFEEYELDTPAAGQVQIRQEAIGLNFIDIYHRTGAFPLPLPSGIGVEGAGVIEAVGEGVDGLRRGDRVVYVGGTPGGYATVRHIAAARVVRLPDGISTQTAASLTFKGLTVEYLIRRCHIVKPGDVVLWQAAAGGVGSIACQWLQHIGATVIGTVSSRQKAEIAKANGCAYPVVYTEEDFVERVKEVTDGKGVSAAYDGIGGDTFYKSLDCLQPRGIMVSFGSASGGVPPLDIGQLGTRGSLFLTRPSIAHYTARKDELEAAAESLFSLILDKNIRVVEPTVYHLKDAAQAQRDLESGKTTGSIVLVP